jgi:hypothetical protein
MTEPVIFGFQGLHAGQQQPCHMFQVMLLVNISSLGCNFLTSKPYLSVIGYPNFILTPYLFLYLIIWDININWFIIKIYTCATIFLSLQVDYNPMAWYENWPGEHICTSQSYLGVIWILYWLQKFILRCFHFNQEIVLLYIVIFTFYMLFLLLASFPSA